MAIYRNEACNKNLLIQNYNYFSGPRSLHFKSIIFCLLNSYSIKFNLDLHYMCVAGKTCFLADVVEPTLGKPYCTSQTKNFTSRLCKIIYIFMGQKMKISSCVFIEIAFSSNNEFPQKTTFHSSHRYCNLRISFCFHSTSSKQKHRVSAHHSTSLYVYVLRYRMIQKIWLKSVRLWGTVISTSQKIGHAIDGSCTKELHYSLLRSLIHC